DNDGDADILIIGHNVGGNYNTVLYRNDGEDTFTVVTHSISPFSSGAIAWADYNGDGFLDVAIGGQTLGFLRTELYRNDGVGGFIPVNLSHKAMPARNLSWTDYDSDGDLDLVFSGDSRGVFGTFVFRNDGNDAFTLLNAGIGYLRDGQMAVLDADNDGDMDLIVAGVNTMDQTVLEIGLNDGSGNFTPLNHYLRGAKRGIIDAGDFDNDGDLDMLVGGLYDGSAYSTILRNDTSNINADPIPPLSLSHEISSGRLHLRWSHGSDAETPRIMLSYALRMGTSPEGIDIVSPLALSDGSRLLHRPGPITSQRSWSIALEDLPPADTYFWSVQTIDSSFQGSVFSAEQAIFNLDIGENEAPYIPAFALDSLHPNPFSKELTIQYTLDKAVPYSIDVFNLKGQRIRGVSFDDGRPGHHTISWDGKDDKGQAVASGIYFIHLSSKDHKHSQRVLKLGY
ncbi:MAG: FG-GAP-like repeat-containing protein, partial [Candidatus Cloacimonadaceae bacterium]|nr:FG-GAP-like repeat-containing protein [Candidatus Cloacimonadaceae bacterium]